MVRNVNTNLEKLAFAGKYSMKNIPIPTRSEYMKKLIIQMEKIMKNMRWKALFFLKDENEKYKDIVEDIELYGKDEKYGFKSVRKPYSIKELEEFEKEFYEIAKIIEFRDDDFK
jgi:tRNA uridine 5-carbamoylmethylation protein Kti12